MKKRESAALSFAVIYIFIMAIAMFTMHHIFKYSYGQPEMSNVLVFFEIIMSIVAYYGYKKLGLSFLSKKPNFSPWAIPFALICVLLVIFYASTGNFGVNTNVVIVIFFTTILVAFSEELIFRGIVLNVFIEKRSTLFSIMISSSLFALFHSVNLLGGTTLIGTIIQLIQTFLFGLVLSSLFLIVNNIIPLMVYHFIWDFTLVSQPITGSIIAPINAAGILIEVIMVIPLTVYAVKKFKKTSF